MNFFQKSKEEKKLLKQAKEEWKHRIHKASSELSKLGFSADQIWKRNLVINS